ncbi:hypothetical protein V500_05238 [Pseudogymnoascus sp. VKM F-4518 (FW-2643)]|nr:hypothetical protein V500_05238 [Pseudogymnoascus sp. VKM F-4518 (FW-2643)]
MSSGRNPAGRSSGGPSQGSGSSSHQRTNSAPPISSMTQVLGGGSSNNRADKKKKMRNSLGGDSEGQASRDASGPPPKTHLLLVQGGKHTAFIGDFLALVEFFQKETSPAFSADFWTSYGPQQYFEYPQNKRHSTIKFENRVVASRHNSEHYMPPYTYIHPTQICQNVFQWIDLKSDTTRKEYARPGDSIILIFLAYGSWNEKPKGEPTGMRLGNNDMRADDFVTALRKISRDVQVNVLSTACYSALFAQKVEEDQQALRWIQVASQPRGKAFADERSASGRYRNSLFISGLVKSLAGLSWKSKINLKEFQTALAEKTESPEDEELKSTPFSYSDSPLDTEVQSLLLRAFADYPFTAQNSAARRRKELKIDMLKRPYPESAALMDKKSFAADMIAEEQNSFGDQNTSMSEDNFADLAREEDSRKSEAGNILRGMLIRGRLQAAVFDIFMQLCLQGVCSLSSLEHPVNWNYIPPIGSCFSWILRMLGVFRAFQVDWNVVQEEWDIPYDARWNDYDVPFLWLGTMIGRTFTSLDVVFDIIRLKDQLGPIDEDALQELVDNAQPGPDWRADINLNRPKAWYGSGTFACWLPENVDGDIINQGFDDAAMALSGDFYFRLERAEEHYGKFFGISQTVFDSDVQKGERDIRDWVREN